MENDTFNKQIDKLEVFEFTIEYCRPSEEELSSVNLYNSLDVIITNSDYSALSIEVTTDELYILDSWMKRFMSEQNGNITCIIQNDRIFCIGSSALLI